MKKIYEVFMLPGEMLAEGPMLDNGKSSRPKQSLRENPSDDGRRLLLFGVTKLSEMMSKGNVKYLTHYQTYFDEVTALYLIGKWQNEELSDKTMLVSLGTSLKGRLSAILDLTLAPYRLYLFAKSYKPTVFLTADIVFSGWTTLLVRYVLKKPIVLMPVCIVPHIYASTGRSLSGLPIWIEKLLTKWCFQASDKVIMSKNGEESLVWLMADSDAKDKLHPVACTVEEFPSMEFMEGLIDRRINSSLSSEPRLLYVGRLHHEKLVVDLIDLVSELSIRKKKFLMVIVGDGPMKNSMQQRSLHLGIDDFIDWTGFIEAKNLPSIYQSCDIFISTVTGTALREAGLVGLPVIAYNVDWVRRLLVHEKTGMLVEVGDIQGLADQVENLIADDRKRSSIATNFHNLCQIKWSIENIKIGLMESFDTYHKG